MSKFLQISPAVAVLWSISKRGAYQSGIRDIGKLGYGKHKDGDKGEKVRERCGCVRDLQIQLLHSSDITHTDKQFCLKI